MTRVLIAAGDGALRSALSLVLRKRLPVTIVGEAVNRYELCTNTAALQPDLVILDWALPEFQGAGDLAVYHAKYPASHIVALSVCAEDGPSLLAAGADGFVHKGAAPDQLIGLLQLFTHP
jgi:DNA-binding NarL/FixJ family response regulator